MAAEDIAALLPSRRGHFALESGNHGDLWLEVDRLFDDPHQSLPFARLLAQLLEDHDVEAICGPATGGAILASQVAREMGIASCPAERMVSPEFAVTYRIGDESACMVSGCRVAVVDDVIGAGSCRHCDPWPKSRDSAALPLLLRPSWSLGLGGRRARANDGASGCEPGKSWRRACWPPLGVPVMQIVAGPA